MTNIPKVFGIGMSKTGTTTLGECLEILGFMPHIGFHPQLKQWLQSGKDKEHILRFAEKYRSFEDTPWYHLYRELDERFPGSKFVLTVRKDSLVHAKSSWAHGARRGARVGEATQEYLDQKIAIYERHNRAVMDYFADRPDDLLVMCWENGDGWEKLCSFLRVPVPPVPIPHANQGRYRAALPKIIVRSSPYGALVRTLHRISLMPFARRVKEMRNGILSAARPKP